MQFSVRKARELGVDLFQSEKLLRPVTPHSEEVEMKRPSSMGLHINNGLD